ncbi:MAG: HAD family hydrolase [Puniceicoccaceae bacterium]
MTLSPRPGSPFGALFDWDGVVVDSSKLHEESWYLLAREADLPLTSALFEKSFGRVNREIIPDIFGWTDDPATTERLGRRKEELYRELILSKGLTPLPGVEKLLLSLHQEGIPAVICTSTERANIETSLEVLGFASYFKDAVCSEDVRLGKPHPEVFLTGASRCNLPPQACVVLEDSRHGLKAARAGGMRSIGVTGTHPASKLEDLATVVVPDLQAVTLETFRKILALPPILKGQSTDDLPLPPHKPGATLEGRPRSTPG